MHFIIEILHGSFKTKYLIIRIKYKIDVHIEFNSNAKYNKK